MPILLAVSISSSNGVQVWEPELVAEPFADFGEGPLWDDARGVWWWTDIPGSVVHRFDPRTNTDEAIPVKHTVGTLTLNTSGDVIVASSAGVGVLASDGSIDIFAPINADDPDLRLNDGKCDTAGRLYVSSMTYKGAEGAGALLRVDPDHSVHELEGGKSIGNGMAWSADGRTFFYTDTPTQLIEAYDVEPTTGDLSNRREVLRIAEADGMPDGFCIDDEGALWIALWQGSSLRRYSRDGEVLGEVRLPVTNVTCAAFGGSEYDELLITTAAPKHSGSGASEPLGGALFRIRPGVTGPPPNPYRG